MAERRPLLITAHNAEHAEYLVRSRAEQRGVTLTHLDVADGSGGMWVVNVEVDSSQAAAAARLGDDTTVLHFDNHRSHRA
jgi:hypothetical protein